MKDGIIKNTGNSRYLKSVSDFLARYPSYADFAEALIAGTLPIDLAGINEAGWQQIGTPLNSENLSQVNINTYTGTGTYGSLNPNSFTFDFLPKVGFIFTPNSSTGGHYFGIFSQYAHYLFSISNISSYVFSNNSTWSENTLSWYGNTSVQQLNEINAFYYVVYIK